MKLRVGRTGWPACAASIALAAVLASCSRREPQTPPGTAASTPSNLGGTYVGELRAADAAGRKLTLQVGAANTVSLHVDYAGKGEVHNAGSWSLTGTLLRVYLETPPDTLEFEMQSNTLVARRWNLERYGTLGLGTLTRQ